MPFRSACLVETAPSLPLLVLKKGLPFQGISPLASSLPMFQVDGLDHILRCFDREKKRIRGKIGGKQEVSEWRFEWGRIENNLNRSSLLFCCCFDSIEWS